MDEKITNLIQELRKECTKEKVTLACVADDFQGKRAIAMCGTSISIALCGITLLETLKKEDVDSLGKLPDTHVHIVDSETDVKEILSKILRGEH